MAEYFVHESSYVDDDVKIGKGQKFGIFVISRQGLKLVRIAPLDKMLMCLIM